MFFPTVVLGTINSVLSPVVQGTAKLLETQTLDMNKYREQKDRLEYEDYIDKRRASYLGKFTSRVCDLHEDYMRPQENGSHYHCEYVSVADDSRKLTVYNEQPLSFNLSEYTEEELTTKGHNYELEKSGYTVFCIDYRQSGIGSGSCGPQLAKEYRLDDTHYTFSFHLKPEIL